MTSRECGPDLAREVDAEAERLEARSRMRSSSGWSVPEALTGPPQPEKIELHDSSPKEGRNGTRDDQLDLARHEDRPTRRHPHGEGDRLRHVRRLRGSARPDRRGAAGDQGDAPRRSACRSAPSSASRSGSSTSTPRCGASRSTGSRRTSTRARSSGRATSCSSSASTTGTARCSRRAAIWDMAKEHGQGGRRVRAVEGPRDRARAGAVRPGAAQGRRTSWRGSSTRSTIRRCARTPTSPTCTSPTPRSTTSRS